MNWECYLFNFQFTFIGDFWNKIKYNNTINYSKSLSIGENLDLLDLYSIVLPDGIPTS